jgi:nucleotide-binding universal stress UspA family protein
MSEIVVGYDGSACGEAALDEALAIAPALGDGVTVVFGYAPPGIWGGEIAEHEKAIEELGANTNKLLHLTDRPVLVVPAEGNQ